ncbi:hypothetical protein KIPB_005607 [Kipferlia bialata]|uniref:Uncharacterized protein n=1 Tax=Kipferlia bialata TaxID=797122 RepID=A0A9K3GIC6_9EUKA|nr:hypothetical protein KIPB_003092 [Kipferlia bialata]GIQ84163.1 hypothetical protein KIPB_005607 [Kipferlia bialata]|eukprot:g3092.t1
MNSDRNWRIVTVSGTLSLARRDVLLFGDRCGVEAIEAFDLEGYSYKGGEDDTPVFSRSMVPLKSSKTKGRR